MSPKKTNKQTNRVPCQIFSRVTGFLTPLNSWNDSKQAEFSDRKPYKL